MATWGSAISMSLREVRIHLCQTSESSKGVRDFINTHYVKIKKLNPNVPFLIRECSGIQPKIYGRYDFGKETCIALTDLSSDEVWKKLEILALSEQ